MILVPLPFLVSVLLVTILVQALRRDEGALRANPLFLALIAAYGVQSVLIGLRWGYDLREVLAVMSPLAALIAPLASASFRSLAREKPATGLQTAAQLLAAPVFVVALMLAWPDGVGPAIVLVFLGYGARLLALARHGPDALVASRLDGVVLSHRAMQVTGGALIASAATDILVGLDFAFGGGAHGGAVVAVANVAALLVLGAAASVAGTRTVETGDTGRNDADGPEQPDLISRVRAPAEPTDEERRIAGALAALMRERRLYRDTDLNLGKIARRLGLAARDVSGAVNRVHGQSVSQYVNALRVAHACDLLGQTDQPVTQVMLEAGFLTKSNFNREFARVTGATPSAWRRDRRVERERASHRAGDGVDMSRADPVRVARLLP